MATRVRESGVRGKEKKGSLQADHSSMPQQHKRTTTTTTTTTSRLISSSSSVNSVPNYLRPTTASSAVQHQNTAAGDNKPHPPRRKSLDRPLPHLDTHRNLAGDKPSPARRKSFDRPIPPHSPLSSSSSSPSSSPSSLPHKPTFSRTKSSLDRPKSSSRTSETINKRGKMMTRSISSVSKSSSSPSSSSIAHHQLKPLSNRPAISKTQKNSPRKQPGTTLSSSKPVKKKPAEIITTTNNHQEPESADHHHHHQKTEVSANPDSNQTEINNNNSKIVQEKENNVVVASDHEELEDLKSIEDSSFLSVPEDPIDLVDTITEEGDEEPISVEISVPENLQESGQIADTTPEDPQVEDKDGFVEETDPTKPADNNEVSVEEKGDENMQPSCHGSENCNEDIAENQEEEEEREKDKKADHHYHHQEDIVEEVKEITEDQNNNNNGGVVPAATIMGAKKNESVVSNDVIEETASKLREQRKNKVKALAGAFETVISLQDK